MSVKSLLRKLVILCVYPIAPLVAQTNAQQAPETLGLGLRPPTEEERAWMERNLQTTRSVRVNALGLERINADRRAKRQGETTTLPPVPFGEESREETNASGAIVSIGSTGSTAGSSTLLGTLPATGNNAALPGFPEVRSQGYLNSCTSFSTTYYVGTHMTALARGWTNTAGSNSRKLSPKWTYTFTNGGENVGTWFTEVFDVLLKLGTPTWAEWPYSGVNTAYGFREWSGNGTIWRNAIRNRFNAVGRVQSIDTDTGLSQVKALVNNGYLLLYATDISGWQEGTLGNDPSTSADDTFAGQRVCRFVKANSSGHAMTIVGYNDNVWTDINKNGVVEAAEKGALLVVNSWGTSWGNAGFMWISYDALRGASRVPAGTTSDFTSGRASGYRTAFWGNEVYWITARAAYTPKVVAQFTLTHAKRSELWIRAGQSATTTTTPASYWPLTTADYNNWQNSSSADRVFKNLGGAFAIDGFTATNPATFALDLSDLATNTSQRFYLEVNDSTAGSPATVTDFRLVDPDGNTLSTSSGVPFSADASTSRAYVDLTVTLPPAIISAASANATVGQSFTFTLSATNSPTRYSAGNLPPGITIDTGSGFISGVPTQAGAFTVALGATNASGTGTASLALTVNPAPVAVPSITSATTAAGTAGSAFSYIITATNSPTSFGAAGLPTGLTVNASTGVISGTPAQTGTFTVALSASNAGGSGSRTLALTVAPPTTAVPAITSAATASGSSGASFSYRIQATNTPTSYGVIDLPGGLSVNATTGVISGTLPVARTYQMTLTATNTTGTGYLTFTLVVNGSSSFGPANDDFANRIPLTGASAAVTGTNVNASAEAGEPTHFGYAPSRSVWWSWTAPTSTTVVISTTGSNFDTLLAVYSGSSVSALTPIASDDEGGGNRTSRVSFSAVAGTTYQIAVDGWSGATGSIQLNLSSGVSAPPNDRFSNRIALSGITTTNGTNVNATAEAGEPAHAGQAAGKSVWWSWTATQSAKVSIDTIGSSFDTVLAVYTGGSVGALTLLASDDEGGGSNTSRLTLNTSAGTTYQIAVDGWSGSEGTIKLNISTAGTAPANDAFANRTALSGSSLATTGTNLNASSETNEPAHAGQAATKSVWWTWTAPNSGQVTIDTIGSEIDTVLAIYRGTSLSALTAVAGDDDSGGNGTSLATFYATSGTVYQIAVDGWSGYEGPLKLNLTFATTVVTNDAFANRITLNGASQAISTLSTNATAETGEPAHDGKAASRSLWWTWTATESGRLSLDTIGSSFDTVLAVYTGTSLGALKLVASDDESGGNATSALAMFVTAGRTYVFAVDGWHGASGRVFLNLNFVKTNELYATDFESFPSGSNKLEGFDGWASNNSTDGVSGILQGSANSKAAWLGYNPTADEAVFVWRPIGFEPVAGGTPLIRFSADFTIVDSTNGKRDRFFFTLYNIAGEALATLVFDNTTSTIYRDDGTNYIPVGTFSPGTRYALNAILDFDANRWSVALNGGTLFSSQTINQLKYARTLGDITVGWSIGTPGQSGDNFMVFDNYRVGILATVGPNLASWTSRFSDAVNGANNVIWTGSQFVVVTGSGTVVTSPDGTNWAKRPTGASGLSGVTSASGMILATSGSNVVTSTDGITWTLRATSAGTALSGIGSNGTRFVAVGTYGMIQTSADGISWSAANSGTTRSLNSVAWGAGKFAVVGAAGTVLTSPDGLTWTSRTSGTTQSLFRVAYAEGRFVAVGSNGTIISSTDGVTWTASSFGGTTMLQAVVWSGNQWVIGTMSNFLLSSPDAITWTRQTVDSVSNTTGLAWNGSRLVAISGDVETALSTADLLYAQAPQITTQPQSQTVAYGTAATFSVVASGTPAPSFQWLKNGVPISGASSASYTVSIAQLSEAGDYTVAVSNSEGTVISSVAKLTVSSSETPPTITTQPQSQTVQAGQTATFSVVVTSSASPFYQWRRNGVAVASATNSSLALQNVQTSDAATYSVVVNSSAGSVTSSPATLRVLSAPVITTQPSSQTIAAGSTVSLIVVATGIPAPTYQWRKAGVAIEGATDSTYTIASAQTLDAVSYDVVVTNGEGSVTSAAAVVTLGSAPTITTQPQSQLATSSGGSVSFSVTATSAATLAYQWNRNGTPIFGATGATLTLTEVQATAAGNYTVRVSNSFGSVLSAIATFEIIQSGNSASHALPAGGYVPGSPLTVTNTLVYSGAPLSLSWSVLLPSGWSFASSSGSGASVLPKAGETGVIEWAWSEIPLSPVNFTYTLNIPDYEAGTRELVALVGARTAVSQQFLARPDPLLVPQVSFHSADTDRNGRIALLELTRVIELYNTRNGTTRTGCYAAAASKTEDGFVAAPDRPSTTTASLPFHHSADSNRDGKISLVELTRVIELYNFRSGTTRTGQYRIATTVTEDGFAPGP